MSDLVAWLSGCYDRAEQRAVDVHHVDCAALPAGGSDDDTHNGLGPDVYEADRCDCGVPSWRLADIGRKRLILAEHDDQHDCGDRRSWEFPYVGCTTARLLAEEFASEPGYDARRWAP